MELILKLFKPIILAYSRIDFYVFNTCSIRLPLSYKIFRKSFVISGGAINDTLTEKIKNSKKRILKSDVSQLPDFKLNIIDEKDEFIKCMNENGYFIFKTKANSKILKDITKELNLIPDEFLDSLSGKYLEVVEKVHSNKLRKKPTNLWCNNFIRNLGLNKEFIELADLYLETKPICDLIASWKSYPTSNTFLKNRAAQMYHFDMDRIKFIKFFIYLTDVNSDNGPHCFIKSSHKVLPKNLRFDGRFNNNDIIEHYGLESEIEICGKKGTIIAVDTRGFHKGKPLISGERQIIQFEYTNSLYGNDQNEKIDLSGIEIDKVKQDLIGVSRS